MGPSPRLREVYLSPLSPIAHATVRILPGKNASRPFPPRFSAARMLSSSSSTLISPSRCMLLTAGGRSFARAHPSAMTKLRITVSWWSGTRRILCPIQRVVRYRKKLAALDFIDELVTLSGSPSSSLATPEDGGDLTPRTIYLTSFLMDPMLRLSFTMITL